LDSVRTWDTVTVPSFNNMTSADSIGFPVPFSRMFPLICEAVAIKEWKQNIKKMRVNVLFIINVLNVMGAKVFRHFISGE